MHLKIHNVLQTIIPGPKKIAQTFRGWLGKAGWGYNWDMNSARPYFLWDYDLTEDDVRRILGGGNQTDKVWILSRILESAKFEDVWKYISLSDVRSMMPVLKIKKPIRVAWERALSIWQ